MKVHFIGTIDHGIDGREHYAFIDATEGLTKEEVKEKMYDNAVYIVGDSFAYDMIVEAKGGYIYMFKEHHAQA